MESCTKKVGGRFPRNSLQSRQIGQNCFSGPGLGPAGRCQGQPSGPPNRPRRGQNPCLGHISGCTGSFYSFEKFLHSKCDRPIDWRRSRGPTRPLRTPLGPRKCRGRGPGGRPGPARRGRGPFSRRNPKFFKKFWGAQKHFLRGSKHVWGPKTAI